MTKELEDLDILVLFAVANANDESLSGHNPFEYIIKKIKNKQLRQNHKLIKTRIKKLQRKGYVFIDHNKSVYLTRQGLDFYRRLKEELN